LYTGKRMSQLMASPASLRSFLRAAGVGLFAPALAAPFAVLAAGLYAQNGLALYLFFTGSVLLGSLLARELSQAVERSQQRFRELAKLEQLGQAIIDAPPDASTLPQLLQEHVPGMFPAARIEVRQFPDRVLARLPEGDDWPSVAGQIWDWLCTSSQASYIAPDAVPPWADQPAGEPLVVVPILNHEAVQPLGGIYVAPQRDAVATASLVPAVQSLAAQVSSALHSAQVYMQTLEAQKMEQELALAGQIQARFLPDVLPEVPGWQLAASLQPARRTSGDFYDVIPLPNGRLGVVVADVADKGMGAALFMALSRTLVRTYALEHHARPDFALRVANNRILSDTQAELFVTVFYGVLDPLSGKLSYCNAGHNPPYLFQARGGKIEELGRTGLPLGIFRGQTWEHRTVQIAPGDTLLLYTDGVTEAQNDAEEFFGEERLLALAQANRGRPAGVVCAAVMDEVHAFVGDAPRYDDIALLVVVREERP
jgi:serine phosphatase RsbU (regulator of sigma subunit)